jgi:hypothetical protein
MKRKGPRDFSRKKKREKKRGEKTHSNEAPITTLQTLLRLQSRNRSAKLRSTVRYIFGELKRVNG